MSIERFVTIGAVLNGAVLCGAAAASLFSDDYTLFGAAIGLIGGILLVLDRREVGQ